MRFRRILEGKYRLQGEIEKQWIIERSKESQKATKKPHKKKP